LAHRKNCSRAGDPMLQPSPTNSSYSLHFMAVRSNCGISLRFGSVRASISLPVRNPLGESPCVSVLLFRWLPFPCMLHVRGVGQPAARNFRIHKLRDRHTIDHRKNLVHRRRGIHFGCGEKPRFGCQHAAIPGRRQNQGRRQAHRRSTSDRRISQRSRHVHSDSCSRDAGIEQIGVIERFRELHPACGSVK